MFLREEDVIRSGLAKSALHSRVHEVPLDFYLPTLREVVTIARGVRRTPKLYQAHDAFFIHYYPLEKVVRNLKKSNKAAPFWCKFVQRFVRSRDYARLNEITKGSEELSLVAAVTMLRNLTKDARNLDDELKKANVPQDQLEKAIEDLLSNNPPEKIVRDTLEAVEEYEDLRSEAESAVRALAGSGGEGFTKEAISVVSYLQDPDDVRRTVRLIGNAKKMLKHFLHMVPTSLQHQLNESFSGSASGVTTMRSLCQVADALPSELALTLDERTKFLFALKVANKQLNVLEKRATTRFSVFVDKSGSMAEKIGGGDVEKISVACGLALALRKKVNAKLYLFDTEVEEVDEGKVVETLLRIRADGGTDITPVLEEICKSRDPAIIISDGITRPESETFEKFKSTGSARRTKLILLPYSPSGFEWVALLRAHGNVFHVRDIAEFERTVKKLLNQPL